MRSIRIEDYWESFSSKPHRDPVHYFGSFMKIPTGLICEYFHLDSIPGLWRDPFHRQHYLELHLTGEVPGRDFPQGRVLVYFVRDDDWPEHLEKVLSSIYFSSEIHAFKMVRNYLRYLVNISVSQ